MRLKLLACEILFRELCQVVSRSPHTVDIEFLPKGLHDLGSASMVNRLQAALDAQDQAAYDAILLGYALCNNGTVGLTARTRPLIIPRAHDCITLFLGDGARYLEYFHANPGVYFETTGWLERGKSRSVEGASDAGSIELRQLSIQHKTGMDNSYEELVEKYGEDNAQYLWETLCDITKHYRKVAYIEMGVEPDGSFEQRAKELAAKQGWEFEKLAGDLGMLRRLVNGDWNDKEFLTVPPGHRVVASFDERLIRSEPASQ